MTTVSDPVDTLEEMAPESQDSDLVRSFMVADCGHSTTSVTLFDVVDGTYRLIAQGSALTTKGPPWYDALNGLQQAISQVTEATGRVLLDEKGLLVRPSSSDGSGVDFLAVTASAAEPFQAFVVGLLEGVSLASARRALHSIYANELDHFVLADPRGQQAQVEAILTKRPEFILLAGGTNGGAERKLMGLLDTLATGISLLEETQRPTVLYAGNDHMRPEVGSVLGELTEVLMAANVRPGYEREQLDHAIGVMRELYLDQKIARVPGLDEVLSWASCPVMPTAHAFGAIGEFFAALYDGWVLGLDIGSNSVTLIAAESEQVQLVVRSDLGLGEPVLNILRTTDASDILEWVISDVSPSEMRDFVFNKALQPQTTPLSEAEWHMEQAIIRKLVGRAIDDAASSWGWRRQGSLRPSRLLLLRGNSLTNIPRFGSVLLTVLDSVQPTGIFPVIVDKHGILPGLGMLAPHKPRLVVEVLGSGVLENLAWVVAPVGEAHPGETVLNVLMETSEAQPVQWEVAYGTLETLPLAPGRKAKLTIQPAPKVDVGQGPGKDREVSVHGGKVGLVIDARGRPLALPGNEELRRNTIRKWLQEVGG